MKCHGCSTFIDPGDGCAEWKGYCRTCYPDSVEYREHMQLLHALVDRLDPVALQLLHSFLDEMHEDHNHYYLAEVSNKLNSKETL